MSRTKDDMKPDPYPSLATADPVARLGVAITRQAIKDFQSGNIMKSLDALCFWLDDGAGPLWLEGLQLGPGDPDHTFSRLLEVKHGGKTG